MTKHDQVYNMSGKGPVFTDTPAGAILKVTEIYPILTAPYLTGKPLLPRVKREAVVTNARRFTISQIGHKVIETLFTLRVMGAAHRGMTPHFFGWPDGTYCLVLVEGLRKALSVRSALYVYTRARWASESEAAKALRASAEHGNVTGVAQ